MFQDVANQVYARARRIHLSGGMARPIEPSSEPQVDGRLPRVGGIDSQGSDCACKRGELEIPAEAFQVVFAKVCRDRMEELLATEVQKFIMDSSTSEPKRQYMNAIEVVGDVVNQLDW